MATFEQVVGHVFKDEPVFVDYLPIHLQEEEVITLSQDEKVNHISVTLKDGITVDYYEDFGVDENVRDNNSDIILTSKFPEEDDHNVKKKPLKTHVCFHCNKMFITRDKMLRHIKMYHKENVQVRVDRHGKRYWVCIRCNKTFISRKGSIVHQRTHTGERPYTCNVCLKCFIDSSTLMKHQVIHQAVRPFSCQMCNRGFNQKVALQRHERTHTQQQQVYTCKYCPKNFFVLSSLQAHEKIHSGIKPFLCNYCPSTFHTSTALRQHERVHTNERPYRCSFCPKAFKDTGTLFKHQIIHSGIKPFLCPFPACAKDFTQKVALKKHIKSHINRMDKLVCSLCVSSGIGNVEILNSEHSDIMFADKEGLLIHLETNHEVRPAKLSELRQNSMANTNINFYDCNNKNASSDLLNHTVSNNNNYYCTNSSDKLIDRNNIKPENGSEFSTPFCDNSDLSDLTTLCDVAISAAKHLNVNNNNNNIDRVAGIDELQYNLNSNDDVKHQYNCRECGLGFKRLKSLKSHLLLGHKLTCKYCDKVYSDRSLLEQHEKLFCSSAIKKKKNINVLSNNNYNCSNKLINNKVVNKRKKGNDKLKGPFVASSKVLSKAKQFYCEACDKSFSSRNGYMIHQRAHTGERPYPCRWCEKAFGDSATRHKHERIHTGERPFVCSQCPRAFNQRAALRAHQITHSVDRAFVCPYCPSSFPYAATLKRHCDTCHSNLNKFLCPICDEVLLNINNLKQHIKCCHVINNYIKSDSNLQKCENSVSQDHKYECKGPSCPLCDSGVFTDVDEFCDHILWHAKQLPITNNTSNKNNNNNRVVNNHKQVTKNN